MNPANLTLGQIGSILRDFGIFVTLAIAVWKARGAWEDVKDYLTETRTFMKAMTANMDTLLNNHVSHIEKDMHDIRKHLAPKVEADE